RLVFIALGFVASFTIVAIGFGAITQIVGIDPDRLRTVAVGLLLIFGLLMLWPRPFEWLGARIGDLFRVARGTHWRFVEPRPSNPDPSPKRTSADLSCCSKASEDDCQSSHRAGSAELWWTALFFG